jgi:hypothetical protein
VQTTAPDRRNRILALIAATGAATLATVLVVTSCDGNTPDKEPLTPTRFASTTTATAPTWQPTALALPDDVRVTYAHIDSTDGNVMLGGDVDTHPLDQLTTPALIADYLQQLSEAGRTPNPAAISHITAALAGEQPSIDWITDQTGGHEAAMRRIINACQLTDTRPAPAEATALDTARYAACLREGAITDADTSADLLKMMQTQKNGIGEDRGDSQLAQHNSTTRDDSTYRTGCLAVAPYWSAAILTTYPTERGEPYGRAICALVARNLFPPDTQKAPQETIPTTPSTSLSG